MVSGRLPALCIVLSMVAISPVHAETQGCIDTTPTTKLLARTMKVRIADRPELVVVGTIAAIDATGMVTFHLPTGDEAVRPTTITIEVPPPNMMAQMAVPLQEDLGPVHARIALKDVAVKEGVVVYPRCVAARPDHELAFMGTLRIDKGALAIDGVFVDYRPADAFTPGGARKPGA